MNPAEVAEFIRTLNPEQVQEALSGDPLGLAELERTTEDEHLREFLFDVLDARPCLFRQLREEAAARHTQELAQMRLPFGKGEF